LPIKRVNQINTCRKVGRISGVFLECLNNNIKNLEEELKNINEHNLKSDKEDETKESLEKEQMEVTFGKKIVKN
jgi:acid phosphatase family membrane protein YuiD